jgi:hypothetical protein
VLEDAAISFIVKGIDPLNRDSLGVQLSTYKHINNNNNIKYKICTLIKQREREREREEEKYQISNAKVLFFSM